MNRTKYDETLLDPHCSATSSAHGSLRWLSQSIPPTCGEAAKLVLSPLRTPHQHSLTQPQTDFANHNQLLALDSYGDLIQSTQPDVVGSSISCSDDEQQHNEQADTGTPSRKEALSNVTAGARASFVLNAGALLPQLAYPDDMQHVGQWYFVSQMSEHDRQPFLSAQEHWVNKLWDMALVSKPMYAAMKAYALHKKASLSESNSKLQYYEQKGRMIQDIIADINGVKSRPHPLTVVAVAILGYLDIRDGHFEAAETHLRAVCQFVDMSRLSLHAWLYCVWSDLRYALFTGKEPVLPFDIPTAFRQLPASVRNYQLEASQRGSINASACPLSPLFTLDMARDVFCNLQALCRCSDMLAATDEPPFGQIYSLEYGLRVVQARATLHPDDAFSAPQVLLLTSAIQIHVWIASRFWTPQRRESHFALMIRACKVMASCSELITQWHASADPESLLWVLFTIVAILRAHERSNLTPVLDLLYKVLRKAGICHCEHLTVALKRWPWLDNWHGMQTNNVWALLCAHYRDLTPLSSRCSGAQPLQDARKARYRWFVGGLEFFNSS